MHKRIYNFYLQRLRPEEPYKKERRRYIERYIRGGYKQYEPDQAIKLSDYPINQLIIIDSETKDKLQWKYVGETWWCRKRTKPKIKYEFARLVSIINYGPEKGKIAGLWDRRIHETKQEPEIVYSKDGVIGHILEYCKGELTIQWYDHGIIGNKQIIKNINDIEFKYEDDHKKYSKIFKR